MPGFPVHHQLPELAQTHVHRVGDAIQPSHPLSSLSPPAFNLSQPQGLFQWVLRIRWPKYCSFSFSIGASYEYSELVSFRVSFPFQVLQSFPIIFVLLICSLTRLWCESRRCVVSILLRCVIKCGSSWWMFHASLRRMYIVLLLDEGVYKCQLDPADWWYYLV